MIGIELGAPSSRVAKLNWRLIHMASGGLFPQLIVIPLHRDHGVITMAAGKNDVIKLLPPLTLSEAEAETFLTAFDAVLADCHDSSSKIWSEVRGIATATIKRRPAQNGSVGDLAPLRGTPIDHSRDHVCLVTGASGFIGGHLAQRLVEDGYQVRCLVRPSSDTSLLDNLEVEIAEGDLTSSRSLGRAVEGCSHVLHCGALVSDWATQKEIAAINVEGTRNLLDASVSASVERFVHFSTTDVYGYPGGAAVDESFAGNGFSNWYSQTKRAAELEVRRTQGLETVVLRPATVYGPRSKEVVGEIARAMRNGNMLLIDRGRSVAGLVYVDNLVDVALLALSHEAAVGHAFNATDGLPVTWKEFTEGLAEGLGCSPARLSMPYWMASGIGFSLEHGYRLLRRTTKLTTQPLLSRQAVHVLGRNQDFSNRKARELLGWEPRVDYATGLAATLDWLQSEK
jgi:nucleoside-diphosphate-sugar epimerase